MNSDCIEIALPSDQNYFPGLLVTAYSIAKNASTDVELSFNILDGGIDDARFNLLRESVLKVHTKSIFRRFVISEQDFLIFPEFHGNRMTYVRFLLPSLLPDNDFVIYVDSDTLWLADIADLWRQRDREVIVKAVFDSLGDKVERPWFEAHDLHWQEQKYFCNGLLLINLAAFRERRIVQRAAEFIAKNPDVKFADQSAFNAVIEGAVQLLPEKWNCFTRDIGRMPIKSPIVLHYANQLPWKISQWIYLVVPFMELWHSVYKEANVGVGYEILNVYNKYKRFGVPALIRCLISYRVFRWSIFVFLKSLRMDSYISSLRFVAGCSR